MDFHASLIFPSNFHEAAIKFDSLVVGCLEKATNLKFAGNSDSLSPLSIPVEEFRDLSFQHHLIRLPISKGGVGLRSLTTISDAAYVGGLELSLPFLTGAHGRSLHPDRRFDR